MAWGIVAAHAAWEGDWRRAHAGLVGLMMLGLLELIVQWRFADDVRGIGFATATVTLFLLGAYGSVHALGVGPAPVYRYVNRWRVAGRIEDVASILRDGEGYPRWWRAVYLEARTVRQGDARRIGEVGRVRARGFLPYAVEFEVRVTDERFPHGYSLVTDGELQGKGEWRIEADGPWVDVESHWSLSGNKPLWRYTSFLLRPLFEANHHWTMRRGEEGLRLELARRVAPTAQARAAVAQAPGPVHGLRDTLRAFAEVLLHVGRGTTVRLSHTTLIRRPPQDVFAFIARVENDLLWQSEISEVTVTSNGPMGVGSTFREVRRSLGHSFVWEMRVTSWEAGRHIAIESVRGTVPYRGSREVAASPGGTQITEISEVQMPWVMQPFSRWIERASLAPVVVAYERLRLQMEAAEVSAPP